MPLVGSRRPGCWERFLRGPGQPQWAGTPTATNARIRCLLSVFKLVAFVFHTKVSQWPVSISSTRATDERTRSRSAPATRPEWRLNLLWLNERI